MAEEDPNKKPSLTTYSLDDERRAFKAYLCAAVLCGLPDELSDPTSPVTCARVAVGGVCVCAAAVTCYCYKEELQALLQAWRPPTPPQGFGHGDRDDPEENGGEQAMQDGSRGLTTLADGAALADAARALTGNDATGTLSDADAARTLQASATRRRRVR